MNMFGCGSDTTSILVSIGTNGVEDISGGSLVLYPVPVRDILHIASDLAYMRIEVLDASGRKVGDAYGYEINLSHLDGGVYLVRLRDSDGLLLGTQKILKE